MNKISVTSSHLRVHNHDLKDQKKALLRRLLSISLAFDFKPERDDIPSIIHQFGSEIQDKRSTQLSWLLLTALSGCFPRRDETLEFASRIFMSDEGQLVDSCLHGSLTTRIRSRNFCGELELLQNVYIADVDFCATNGHNTGIQRVVRNTFPGLAKQINIIPVSWIEPGIGFRRLTSNETTRVLDWDSSRRSESSQTSKPCSEKLLVPWNSDILLMEVPAHMHCSALATIAEFSGNRIHAIGYDAIPITSADEVPESETEKFAAYLSVIKHVVNVFAISKSASEEFEGFKLSVQAQGLSGPKIQTISLANSPLDVSSKSAKLDIETSCEEIKFISVGSQEPRKNHLMILRAAEMLWQEGFEFSLELIGHRTGDLSRPLEKSVEYLKSKKRKIKLLRNISDKNLARAYDYADVSIFISKHEGYGLPVAESLSHGTPVIATNYGSISEIAEFGGCLLVNPRDIFSVTNAMKSILTSKELLNSLKEQAKSPNFKGWDEYSKQLSNALVGGALS